MSIRRLLSSLGATLLAKRFSSCQCPCANKYKVAVIGACGGIGQPLSLLMKLNPNVSELRLHDLEEWTRGVAADLSHIETAAKVSWTCGNNMSDALCGGVDIILVPAGMPRKPGMKRSDLFKSNAEVAFYAAEAMAKVSPDSILILVTNPVNALLPICCEVLKHYGKLCPQRVIGASTLDSVRAATFVAELTCADPKDITIPVVGGHSGSTILPLLSRANPAVCFDEKTADDVIKKIQQAGTTVLNAKKGHGTATLAMAYAASRLAFAIIRALNGEPNIVECCYVLSDVYPELKYMSTPLLFGKCGIEKNLGLGKLSDKEQKMFCAAVPAVQKDIEKGEQFAKEMLQKSKCK